MVRAEQARRLPTRSPLGEVAGGLAAEALAGGLVEQAVLEALELLAQGGGVGTGGVASSSARISAISRQGRPLSMRRISIDCSKGVKLARRRARRSGGQRVGVQQRALGQAVGQARVVAGLEALHAAAEGVAAVHPDRVPGHRDRPRCETSSRAGSGRCPSRCPRRHRRTRPRRRWGRAGRPPGTRRSRRRTRATLRWRRRPAVPAARHCPIRFSALLSTPLPTLFSTPLSAPLSALFSTAFSAPLSTSSSAVATFAALPKLATFFGVSAGPAPGTAP